MRLIDADAAIKDANLHWGSVHDAVMIKHFLDAQPSVHLNAMTLDEINTINTQEPENEPLSPEQLRHMVGEPVWVCEKAKRAYWAIVTPEWESAYANYGKDWWAYARKVGAVYRHKPEGAHGAPPENAKLSKEEVAAFLSTTPDIPANFSLT